MFNFLLGIQIILFLFSIYFLGIALAGLYTRRCRQEHPPRTRFAIIVPARNEEKVIGKLAGNLLELDYPKELYDVFVVADHCSDRTAAVARSCGVTVWERLHCRRRGCKGYVLEYALARLGFTRGRSHYDAAVIFDADNLVSTNFLQVMNNRLLEGEKVIQCFVDSKNPDDNWVTAVFSLTFWLNNRFMLLARYNLGLSACLAGTGMCIAREVLQAVGWNTSTITEDLEFSVQALLKDYRTSFAVETRVYDEKPLCFIATCHQRLRWARGQINVAYRYLPQLIRQGLREKNLIKLEGGMRLGQLFAVALGGLVLAAGLIQPDLIAATSIYKHLGKSAPVVQILLPVLTYLMPLATAVLDRLPARPFRYLLLYPFFTLSWVVLILYAMFTWLNRRWVPTHHSRALNHRTLFSRQTPQKRHPAPPTSRPDSHADAAAPGGK